MPYDLMDVTPRQPKQARGRAKVEQIIVAAQQIIEDQSADALSSPAVAEMAGIPVASVYQFFPTRYAILNEIGRRQVEGLSTAMAPLFEENAISGWREGFERAIEIAANYIRGNKLATELFLRGPIIPEILNAHLEADDKVAEMITEILPEEERAKVLNTENGLNPIRVAINLAVATMALGHRMQGDITENVVAETKSVVNSYLDTYLQA